MLDDCFILKLFFLLENSFRKLILYLSPWLAWLGSMHQWFFKFYFLFQTHTHTLSLALSFTRTHVKAPSHRTLFLTHTLRLSLTHIYKHSLSLTHTLALSLSHTRTFSFTHPKRKIDVSTGLWQLRSLNDSAPDDCNNDYNGDNELQRKVFWERI